MGFKSGFAGVLGQANVGKSTFINALLGKKLLIVSEKRQSTRNRIRCILNTEDAQIIFVDTPGLHKPVDKLSKYLVKQAYGALGGLDLILYMIEPWVQIGEYDRKIFEQISKLNKTVLLLINKIDTAEGNEVPETIRNYAATSLFAQIVPISCKLGINLDTALNLIKAYLPEGPKYFPDEMQVDRPEDFVIAEFIREKVYNLTQQEVPYSVAVEVFEMRERTVGARPANGRGEASLAPTLEIYANIYVARESQKGILIGKGGRMIKEIGTQARAEIEKLLNVRVYLDLRVKVKEKWNEDEEKIARMLGRD